MDTPWRSNISVMSQPSGGMGGAGQRELRNFIGLAQCPSRKSTNGPFLVFVAVAVRPTASPCLTLTVFSQMCNKEPAPQLLTVLDKDGPGFAAPYTVTLNGDTKTNWTARMNDTSTYAVHEQAADQAPIHVCSRDIQPVLPLLQRRASS